MPLVRLFYASRCRADITAAEVRRVIGTSQVNNRRRGITGLLVYSGHAFAQVLEGDAGEVDGLMARIESDPRHETVRVLRREDGVRARDFGQWAMHLLESPATDDALTALLGQDTPDPSLVDATLGRIRTEVAWHAG